MPAIPSQIYFRFLVLWNLAFRKAKVDIRISCLIVCFLWYIRISQYLLFFASAVYATANPSVRPSVTLRYCVQMRERRGVRFSLLRRPVHLAFWCREWLLEDDYVQVRYDCENNRAVHISPHSSATVIDSKRSSISSIKANEKSTVGFPTSHQPRSSVTLKFPTMGFRYPNFSFIAEISTQNR